MKTGSKKNIVFGGNKNGSIPIKPLFEIIDVRSLVVNFKISWIK
jgi:hypothetical protein